MGLATEPIEVDGTSTERLARSVYAVDAPRELLWKSDPNVRLNSTRNSWAARTNRGVAVWKGKVYVATGDCRLVALDAATGSSLVLAGMRRYRADRQHRRPTHWQGQGLSSATTALTQVRGSLAAFDANTGKVAWRFWNVPGDPSKGFETKALGVAAKTWTGDRWWRLAAATSGTPIDYDPEHRGR